MFVFIFKGGNRVFWILIRNPSCQGKGFWILDKICVPGIWRSSKNVHWQWKYFDMFSIFTVHKYNKYSMLHTVYTFLQFIQLSQKVAPKSWLSLAQTVSRTITHKSFKHIWQFVCLFLQLSISRTEFHLTWAW